MQVEDRASEDSDRLKWSLLVVLLCLAWADAKHRECFTAEELGNDPIPVQFRNWVSLLGQQDCVQLVPFLQDEQGSRPWARRHHGHSCPGLKVQDMQSGELHKRSISPWTYYIDEDEDRYPRQLAFARCSCKGCINSKDGQETTDLNSVEVFQRTTVFRRKACPHNGGSVEKFTFEKDYINVPVACTCAVPQYSS
ncbi:interleukin-17C [Thamnophis elegans]|uniref:interleukin-17C n=1 Tax=Thamnophis elegans TaxID=35005 RepID=UPI001377C760|nr:interleukin-17C [Thamnophis elegans]